MTIVTVDLSTGEVVREAVPGVEQRRDAGHGLLGTRLLLERTEPGLDPFDPASLFVVAGSPVSGRDGVGLARCTFVAKSPATGGIGEARAEGPFGVALASTGITALVVTGRAQEPSVVVVTPTEVRVEPTPLWDTGTGAATDALAATYGETASVAAIGPAGERLVRFASIVTDRTHVAARMGLGAVAGSKLLKAVVVLPGEPAGSADPARVEAITAAYRSRIPANPQTAEQAGLPGSGAWPVSGGVPGYVTALNATTALLPIVTVTGPDGVARRATPDDATARVTGVAACPGCPLDCIKTYDNAVDPRAAGLDEESLAAFAYGLGITDLDEALRLVATTRDLGVDPVSLAGVVGFAAECWERGGVGAEVRFGDPATIDAAVRGVALCELEWEWLSDGVARAALQVPEGLRDAALHVSGLEVTTWDARASAGQTLATAVSPIGPRYEIVEHDIDFDPLDGPAHGVDQLERLGSWSWSPMERLDDERVERTAFLMDLWSGLDAIGICLLAGPPVRELDLAGCAGLVSAVTGWDVEPPEILAWGRRRLALMRRYNAREGVEPGRLPARYFDDPLDAGRFAGRSLDRTAVDRAVARYHDLTREPLETA